MNTASTLPPKDKQALILLFEILKILIPWIFSHLSWGEDSLSWVEPLNLLNDQRLLLAVYEFHIDPGDQCQFHGFQMTKYAQNTHCRSTKPNLQISKADILTGMLSESWSIWLGDTSVQYTSHSYTYKVATLMNCILVIRESEIFVDMNSGSDPDKFN